jgi:hypothetical protein
LILGEIFLIEENNTPFTKAQVFVLGQKYLCVVPVTRSSGNMGKFYVSVGRDIWRIPSPGRSLRLILEPMHKLKQT